MRGLPWPLPKLGFQSRQAFLAALVRDAVLLIPPYRSCQAISIALVRDTALLKTALFVVFVSYVVTLNHVVETVVRCRPLHPMAIPLCVCVCVFPG